MQKISCFFCSSASDTYCSDILNLWKRMMSSVICSQIAFNDRKEQDSLQLEKWDLRSCTASPVPALFSERHRHVLFSSHHESASVTSVRLLGRLSSFLGVRIWSCCSSGTPFSLCSQKMASLPSSLPPFAFLPFLKVAVRTGCVEKMISKKKEKR